jgi:hypothetical protein
LVEKFKDCYATGFQAPVADENQDWILLDGAEQDGYSILKYRRKLLSCDSQFDRNITVSILIRKIFPFKCVLNTRNPDFRFNFLVFGSFFYT